MTDLLQLHLKISRTCIQPFHVDWNPAVPRACCAHSPQAHPETWKNMECCISVLHHFQASLVRVHSSPLSSANAAQASIIILPSGPDSQPNLIPGSCATHFKPKTEVLLRNALPSFPCSSWQATSSTARITLAPPKKQLNDPGFLPPRGHRPFQLLRWLRLPRGIFLRHKQILGREEEVTKRAGSHLSKAAWCSVPPRVWQSLSK